MWEMSTIYLQQASVDSSNKGIVTTILATDEETKERVMNSRVTTNMPLDNGGLTVVCAQEDYRGTMIQLHYTPKSMRH